MNINLRIVFIIGEVANTPTVYRMTEHVPAVPAFNFASSLDRTTRSLTCLFARPPANPLDAVRERKKKPFEVRRRRC